jgi:hypothetical protein
MRFFATTILLTLFALQAPAWAEGDVASPGEHEFIGASSCKICHKAEAKGDQYGKWLASAHAKAYETLASDKAKEIAAAKKLGDNPQAIGECLSCHVTGHGAKAELLGKKYDVTEGVGCESCHGAGGDYKKKSVMEDREASVGAGLVIPDAKTCMGCHNEKSPTFTAFDFDKMFAKIAHPNPEKAAGTK